MATTHREASIREVKAKLSEAWLAEGIIEITSNGHVVAAIYPAIYNEAPVPNSDPRVPDNTGVRAPTPITPAVDRNTDPRVPPNTGSAHPVNTRGVRPRSVAKSGVWTGDRQGVGLSKADQASGKSRMKG